MKDVIIFANGDLNNGLAVQQALSQQALGVAADGGAHLAQQLGYPLVLVIGDMDSISSELLQTLRQNDAVEILQYPSEKDQTDLELALILAVERGAQHIRIIGGLGGRIDQILANIYLLNLPQLQGCDVRMVSGNQTIWCLESGDYPLAGDIGDTVSLIPLGGDVEGISTDGLQYSLQAEPLFFGPARGISNVIDSASPRIQFKKGRVLVVHTIGRA